MGCHPSPSFPDIFMAKIHHKIKMLVENLKLTENISMEELFRFLDDLFSVFEGTTQTTAHIVEPYEQVTPFSGIHDAPHHSRHRIC